MAMEAASGMAMAHRIETHETRSGLRTDRLAGVGGLVFVATLVVQNIIRAAGPGFGAAPSEVSRYFTHPDAAVLVPLGLFPIGMFALLMFVAGVWNRGVDTTTGRWWAAGGTLGAAAIVGLFALVNIVEIALAAKAGVLAATPGVVQALWAVHAGAFGLDLGAIAVTLVGLSRAAAAARLIPQWIAIAALPGAACLVIASIFTVAIANGAPWIALGLVGFLIWLAFVSATSLSLLRAQP
jgi:hypothetical protein